VAERTDRGRNGDGWTPDPTKNVLDLVAEQGKRIEQAAILREKRQDDLRKMEREHRLEMRRVQERCGKEISDLREQLAQKETQRLDAINLADSRKHDGERAEDKANVAIADAKAEGRAEALAQRVEAARQALDEQEGGRAQQTAGRQVNQWAVGLFVGVVVVAAEVALRLSGH
jgi:hypothetical protein